MQKGKEISRRKTSKGGTIKKARREKEEKTKKGTREINLDEGQRPKSLETEETRRTKILEKEGTGRQRRERRAMAKGKKETPRRIKILEKEETESQRRERRAMAKEKEETPTRIKVLERERKGRQTREIKRRPELEEKITGRTKGLEVKRAGNQTIEKRTRANQGVQTGRETNPKEERVRTKKSKKKNNKSGKRSRKAKRRKEKKIKKTKKQKDRKQNRQATNQTSSRCGVEIAQLGQHLPKALSWIQQGKRCDTNIKQKANKAKKKGDFKGQYDNALPSIGGDDKKPKCKGKTIDNKDNFTVSMETLKKCNTSIKAACEKALPANLQANIKKCNDLAEKYRVDYRKELLKATEDKICENAKKLKTSWAEVEKACEKDFNVTKAELDQLKERQACIKAFGECRKGERTLPKEMKRCMPVCKSGNTTATTPKGGKKHQEE